MAEEKVQGHRFEASPGRELHEETYSPLFDMLYALLYFAGSSTVRLSKIFSLWKNILDLARCYAKEADMGCPTRLGSPL